MSIKKIPEYKFSLCRVRKCIDKQPISITKPYIKAFLDEKKDMPNYCFCFPYVPHVPMMYKKHKILESKFSLCKMQKCIDINSLFE